MPAKSAQVLLGLDFGTKKTGIAIGQTYTQTAKALKAIPTIGGIPSSIELNKIIQEWQPDIVIMGKPATLESGFQKKLNKVACFIKDQYQLETIFVDESLTTEQANFEMYSQQIKRDRKKQQRDAISARLILETYMLS